MNELKEKEAQELSKEEINVYAAGSGEIQNIVKMTALVADLF